MTSYAKFDDIGREEEEEEKQLEKQAIENAKQEIAKVRSLHRTGHSSDDDDEDDSDDDNLSPLFWTKPPSLRKHASKQALEMEQLFNSWVYDDKDLVTLAKEAKDRANLAFKQGHFPVARDAYKEALQFAYKSWTVDNDASEILATVLSNRAQLELQLKNYRSAIHDCKASLKLSPSGPVSNKARFRGAKACVSLNKPEMALKVFLLNVPEQPGFVIASAKLEEELKQLSQLKRTCLSLQRELDDKKKREADKAKAKEQEDLTWRQRLQKRGIKLGPLTMDLLPFTGGTGVVGGLGPLPQISSDDVWSWPVLFMYPEYSQSEFVQAFKETVKFSAMMSEMFAEPPNWDTNRKYTRSADLDVYFRERQSRAFDYGKPLFAQHAKTNEDDKDFATHKWFRVPMNLTLGEVLQHSALVVPGLPIFVVLSRRSPSFQRRFIHACQEKDGPVREMQ